MFGRMPYPRASLAWPQPVDRDVGRYRSGANVEKSLSNDSSITTGMTMAVGAQASDEAIAGVKAALTTGKGAMTVINGMKQAFGLDPGTKGARDYEQLRFGPEIPAGSIALRDSASAAVLAAMGVHPALFSGGGEGQREAHRLMVAGTVQALAASTGSKS